MHISNQNGSRNIPEKSCALFKSLELHNQRSSLLFSIDLQVFLVNEHLFDSNERRFMRWKNKSKRNYFLYLLPYTSRKLSLSPCLLSAKEQRLVICKEKTLMSLLGSYEKLVWAKIFYLSLKRGLMDPFS